MTRETLVRGAALAAVATFGIGFAGLSHAAPADGGVLRTLADTTSTVEDAQYTQRRTRRGIRKCYREFVVGRWVCRTYRYW
jgi:hypothetical protein